MSGPATNRSREPIFTAEFIKLCASGIMFFMSFNMIVPELPAYITSLGGGELKGLIISLFTVTAGLSRPFSGKLADTIGRIPVMVTGALVCVLCGVLYPMASSVWAFLALRFFHGFSTGFKPTGTAAYVADIVPFSRRGEAMGYLGFFNSMGLALGPVMGSLIAAATDWSVMFYCSSFFAFMSVAILLKMPETLAVRQRFRLALLKIRKEDFYAPSVLPAAIVMMFSVYSYGMVLTVIPDFSDALGVANRGYFFSVFVAAQLIVRLTMGKLSDVHGREPVIAWTLAGLLIAECFMAFVTTQLEFFIVAFSFGLCIGNLSPALFAWTIDLGDRKFMGRAVATMYIALEIGIGAGAFISGWQYGNEIANISLVFLTAAGLCGVALVYLLFYMRTHRKTRKKHQSGDLADAVVAAEEV